MHPPHSHGPAFRRGLSCCRSLGEIWELGKFDPICDIGRIEIPQRSNL
jgi:hypothetical protein